MKEFTKDMQEKLWAANEAVKGTTEYTKYHMETAAQTNGRWHFIGWYIPYTEGKIKTFKDKTYIVVECQCGYERYLERYTVRDSVKELLGI